MNDLKTLVEAIERRQSITNSDGTLKGKEGGFCPFDAADKLSAVIHLDAAIADAFCCQDAIKDTVVESLGFIQKPEAPYWVLSTAAVTLTWSGISGSICAEYPNADSQMVHPQPQTRGDLLHLLWRLTRPETTK